MEEKHSESKPFETWAVLEIMGHDRYAGLVTEQAVGGCAFVRVDVPAIGNREDFTKLFGQGSIFSITPVSETVARAMAESFQSKPLNVYAPDLQRNLLPASSDFDRGDVDEEYDL